MLLHTCCAHCLAYPLKVLNDEGFKVTVYWYNPNIHPFMEYRARKEAVKQLAEFEDIDVIFGSYDFIDYLKHQLTDIKRPQRCENCYRYRLKKTASYGKKEGFDAFTTTLLSSPFQYHDNIKKIGEDTAEQFGIRFYYNDFRENTIDAKASTKRYGLYRQNYCGCLSSEWERFSKTGNQDDTN